MIIYIAGKITGEPLEACKAKFELIQRTLLAFNYQAINPFKLGCQDHWTFEQTKPYNFKALRQCNAIFMLEDYEDSPGALEELTEAKRLNLEVFYETANDIYQLIGKTKLHRAEHSCID